MDNAFCECGCGSIANIGKRFISGHNNKGRRKAPNIHSCQNCKKEFETRPYIKSRTYCSTDCRDQFRRKQTGASHPLYNRANHPCEICGKMVLVTPSMLKSRRKCFCSAACSKESHRRAVTGIPKAMNRTGKNAARVRDGGKCVMCGFSVVTAVHHIVSKKTGGTNEITNLVTLCPNHHYMAHAGLLDESQLTEKAGEFSFYEDRPVLTARKGKKVNFRG